MGSGTRVYAESGRGAVIFGILDNFSFFLFLFWFLEITRHSYSTFTNMKYGPPTLFYFNSILCSLNYNREVKIELKIEIIENFIKMITPTYICILYNSF